MLRASVQRRGCFPDVSGGLPASLLFIISPTQDVVSLAGNLEMACLFVQICWRDSIVVKDGRVTKQLETHYKGKQEEKKIDKTTCEHRICPLCLWTKMPNVFSSFKEKPVPPPHPWFRTSRCILLLFFNSENLCILSDTRTGSSMSFINKINFLRGSGSVFLPVLSR